MQKKPIIPSVYNFEFDLIKNSLEDILRSKEVGMVHFDGLNDLSTFKNLIGRYAVTADVHLLNDIPLAELNSLLRMNLPFPIRVSMHVESNGDKREFSKIAKENNISPGLAIKLKTPISSDASFYEGFDYIHLICNDDANGLNFFQKDVYKKIKSLRELLKNRCTITLDAGVKEEHIELAIENGASNLVMGSAIFKNENPLETIMKFNRLANTRKIN